MPNYTVVTNPAIEELSSYKLFSKDIIDVLPR